MPCPFMTLQPAPGCFGQYIGIIYQFLVLDPFQEDPQAVAGLTAASLGNPSVVMQVFGTDWHGLGQYGHIGPERFRPFCAGVGMTAA